MQTMSTKCLLVVGIFTCAAISASGAEAAVSNGAPVDFQRQVRHILSDNCFLCHGPDKGTRMADVRLDIKEGAFASRKNGTIIVPGKPDESLLIKRITSDNPAYRMPPAFSHKTLTPEQKDILRRWVAQGAPWKEHWAFIAPVKPAAPSVSESTWVRNPIDSFVVSSLEANHLKPAPEADRPTLIRRVTLALTGLPPTEEEVARFVADQSPDAYERLVDHLMASPQYGEHMAHYWLDAARYADTQGLHIDNYREMWPYRDWVIKAFNQNMRFDRFTVEQLAGDLLPNATLDQRIASGFQRCNVTTNEGGSIPAEVEAMYARDRADTTGTVWMGLTVGCATCHDHKFDPIAQKEFYSLTSFFRNTTQYALDGNVPNTPPVVNVPAADDRPQWDQLEAQRANVSDQLADIKTDITPEFESWLRKPAHRSVNKPFLSSRILRLNTKQAASVSLRSGTAPVVLPANVTLADGPTDGEKSLHFGKEASVKLTTASYLDADKPFTVAFWVQIPKLNESFALASQIASSKAGKETKEWGWSARITSNNSEPSMPSIMLQGNNGKYISAQPAPGYGLKPKAWYHIAFTYDGSRSNRGIQIYVNGTRVPSYGTGQDLAPLVGSIRTTNAPLLLGRKGEQYFEGGSLAGFRILDKRVDEQDAKLLVAADLVESAMTKEVADLSEVERQALLTYYMDGVNARTKPMVADLHKIDADRYQIVKRSATTFVQEERKDSQPVAHVLYRGLYDQMKEEVHPDVPAVLPPMTKSEPRNRLGLAQWLVDPGNPLTARVTVNRFWQQLFGTGIVKTAEDFGSQGEAPSNQQLLDWLAVDFRESGWDVKRTLRLMVTSATYRQSAEATSEKLEKDRDNRLLSRGPRYRMDAEMLRDTALFASGLLVPKIGGPSVKPYQPPKVWETVAMDNSNTRFYKADTGDKLYRRSLYTFWKRSAPPPSMDIFDAPSREECVVRRERTNTPLQALVTMDDPQFVEAARVLAEKALTSSPQNVDAAFDYLSYRLLSRSFNDKERAVVKSSYKDYLSYYDSTPADAKKLIAVGESKAPNNLAAPELAAMTMVANEVMNLDEVLVN
jgi:mono/diheme cytochrome c family protein